MKQENANKSSKYSMQNYDKRCNLFELRQEVQVEALNGNTNVSLLIPA